MSASRLNENEPNEDIEEALSINTQQDERNHEADEEFIKHLPRISGKSQRRSRVPNKLTRWQKFKAAVSSYFSKLGEDISNYWRRVFTLSMARGDPISFCRPEDFNAAGDLIEDDDEEYEKAMDLIEAACNYSEKTKVAFEHLITARKAFAENMMNPSKGIDWSQLAPWNESFLGHLETTFKTFDSTGDHMIDFEETSLMLRDFGDKTPEDERMKVLQDANTSGSGALNFTEFIVMFHNITVKSPESYPSTLVEAFRSIDRNMARIRGLDVVQQLQAGLF